MSLKGLCVTFYTSPFPAKVLICALEASAVLLDGLVELGSGSTPASEDSWTSSVSPRALLISDRT